jgi:hypothetical protein
MRVHDVHERTLAATPEQVESLFEDIDAIWPDPQPVVEGVSLRMGPMLWQRFKRGDTTLAWRISSPRDLPAVHWFDIHPDGNGGTLLRHTVEGQALGECEAQWRDEIEPMFGAYIEALFNRTQERLA